MIALWWVACGGEEVEVPVVVPPPAEARPELEPYRGRWLAAQRTDRGWVVCEGGPSVELREEGNRWDLVVSMPDDLRVIAIGPAAPSATGLHLEADGSAVELTWVEADRIASFAGLVEGRTFARPAAGKELPVEACPR